MKKKLLFLSINLFAILISFSQITHGGMPFSSDAIGLKTIVSTEILPQQDARSFIKEDVQRDLYKDNIWRFGINIPVNLDIKNLATIDKISGGTIYRYRIYSEGAVSINFRFSNYKLPKGASLFIYNDDKSEIIGSFTSSNNKKSGVLGVSFIQADAITLEYFEPNNTDFDGELIIDRVTHAYRSSHLYTDKGFGSSGNCNNDVVCAVSAGWEEQINSVGMLVSGGNGFCTGAMINNSSLDGTPYFLTADHCYSDPSDWVFRFNWHKTTCETSSSAGVASSYDEVSGATLKARYAASDFCLVELSTAPPSSYNVFYAGWDNLDEASTSSCGIHHPAGDVKKISFDNDPSSSSNYLGSGTPNSHWKISSWDDGTTEGGSSGSPLFNQNHKIIGQLHGGYASCSNNSQDVYGKLAMSWIGGGIPGKQLKYWLGPCGYELDTLEGFYPTTHVLDAQLLKILSPIDTYCSEETINPQVVIRNLGTTNLTSCKISYNIDGGTNVNGTWNGDIAILETDTFSFSSITLTSGTHYIYFTLSSPNGGTDEVLNSNYCTKSYTINVEIGQSLPYTVDFEEATFPPSNITLINPDASTTWERSITAAGNGTSTAATFISCLDYSSTGAEDVFQTPKLNLVGLPDAELTFNIAYRRYNGTYFERFKVLVSDDCEVSWDVVYNKSSTTLATGTDQTSVFTPSVASDWRMDTVNLTAYIGSSISVKFINVNGYGNYIYLDDINITSSIYSGIDKLESNLVNIYPNPAKNKFVIETNNSLHKEIKILNIVGNVVIQINTTDNIYEIDSSNLVDGVYFVVISTSENRILKKIVIE